MNLKTTLLTLAAAVTMVGVSAAGAFAAPASIAHGATLYAHPGWSKIGAVGGGQWVDVGGCSNGYCYISKPGKDGFVKANAIAWQGNGGGWHGNGGGWNHHHHHMHDAVCVGGWYGGFCVQ
jgi:hypothetical protein